MGKEQDRLGYLTLVCELVLEKENFVKIRQKVAMCHFLYVLGIYIYIL